MIPQVTVLHGHDSQDTAYLIGDYPYGRLRCQMRVWVDGPPAKGQYKGLYRIARQTSNPKRGNDWGNKPHYGQYHMMVIPYLDGIDHDGNGTQHVEFHQVYRPEPAQDALIRADGTYAQLTTEQRSFYDAITAYTRKGYPGPWDSWDALTAYLAARLAATGTVPPKEEVDAGSKAGYVNDYDYATACAVACHQAGI